ncbi:MAG: ferrous iron transport protein A [Gammaproteobacteria bacterium]|nr:MAG: ferrous iron transport protein A [Gammaproteobacteria bacterium]
MRSPVANEPVKPEKTLWDLARNERCLIRSFHGDLDEVYRVRLMELGFHPGEVVTCLYTPQLGAPRLYRVHNTVYSLDDDVAALIHISEAA